MTTPSLVDLLKAKTSEGAQELLARERTGVKELRAEVGGVLRPRISAACRRAV